MYLFKGLDLWIGHLFRDGRRIILLGQLTCIVWFWIHLCPDVHKIYVCAWNLWSSNTSGTEQEQCQLCTQQFEGKQARPNQNAQAVDCTILLAGTGQWPSQRSTAAPPCTSSHHRRILVHNMIRSPGHWWTEHCSMPSSGISSLGLFRCTHMLLFSKIVTQAREIDDY